MVINFMNKLQSEGENIKNYYCGNVGGNNDLDSACTKYFGKIKFDVMSTETLHKNGILEQLFATIYSWISIIIMHRIINKNFKSIPWPKFI